jgi:small GTP-binding protein
MSEVSIPPAKVIMLGDSSVGKTSLVVQLHRATFEPGIEPTVGAAYITKVIQTASAAIPLHIWDTAGQERFKSLIPMYIRGCAAVVLVCAADSFESFASLESWHQLLQLHAPGLQHLYLVVNKIDRPEQFDFGAATAWAKAHNAKHFRTCAAQGETVLPVFQEVAEDLAGHNTVNENASSLVIPEANTRSQCC